MKIYFHGATGDVTGSAYHIVTRDASVLVDCGLFQGRKEEREKNRRKDKLEGGRLDAVVLTHGHLDHVGRLPLLTKKGYDGPIYATKATIELATLILRDALSLQKNDFERENRKRARANLELLEPLFEESDVRDLKPLTRAIEYNQTVEIASGIQIRLVDAGHVIGSASVEMTIDEDGKKKIVVFSGDLGPRGAPLLNDPTPFERADVVIMESTYGDRDHRSLHETAVEGRKIIAKAIENRAKILVPIFAVGRTQLLLYLLAGAFKRGTLPQFPIYLDSPMAIEATQIYSDNNELFDAEALEMAQSGELRRQLEFTYPCPTPDDSRALNNVKGPCLIMAGNGTCNGGRILHHLRDNLPSPETAVLIVGFQSPGSIGRQLVEGAEEVTIFGEKIPVRASIHTMGGFSAHAGQSDLLEWLAPVAASRPRVILTHGEDSVRKIFSEIINARFGLIAESPQLGDCLEI